MRYSSEHKTTMRKHLLTVAGAETKKKGFAAVGVDGLMQAAGVTSGAFYSHFSSKNELFKAVVEAELQDSIQMLIGNPHQDLAAWLDHESSRYLTMSHVRHPEAGCVLPALGAEISRADDSVKKMYEQQMLDAKNTLASRLGDDTAAWGFIAQCVGSLLLARAMPNEETQQAVINASKQFLQRAITQGTGNEPASTAGNATPSPHRPPPA
ncbi:TetR/AcrR family transcriptional regulator [Undibacterium sp.]|jgi:TetR/AcrR family transcriptional repressor of nem operon|uniref:TetR/AcrR family transcriptional regulator n=1 Tax=Undibacterium sp. TaxID=1914977 RepID=UPI002CD763FC|nr:TetR/AcrR family transcriptional regulator [Undibacterium sp.]HTD04596.1 TetR/AcrR family transcriptional regulator [Undibacterium sp.]